jgi:hypothetical protein
LREKVHVVFFGYCLKYSGLPQVEQRVSLTRWFPLLLLVPKLFRFAALQQIQNIALRRKWKEYLSFPDWRICWYDRKQKEGCWGLSLRVPLPDLWLHKSVKTKHLDKLNLSKCIWAMNDLWIRQHSELRKVQSAIPSQVGRQYL